MQHALAAKMVAAVVGDRFWVFVLKNVLCPPLHLFFLTAAAYCAGPLTVA